MGRFDSSSRGGTMSDDDGKEPPSKGRRLFEMAKMTASVAGDYTSSRVKSWFQSEEAGDDRLLVEEALFTLLRDWNRDPGDGLTIVDDAGLRRGRRHRPHPDQEETECHPETAIHVSPGVGDPTKCYPPGPSGSES